VLSRTAAALLIVAALSSLLAACGGGGDHDEQAPTQSTPASAPPSGEKSVEGFGEEATAEDREAILSAEHAYLEAIAVKRYREACTHLGERMQASLSQLVGKRDVDCASILPGLLSPSAASTARAQANGKITKVRVEGDEAFVIFRAPGARRYVLTMVREGSDWKATSLIATILVPSAATLGR